MAAVTMRGSHLPRNIPPVHRHRRRHQTQILILEKAASHPVLVHLVPGLIQKSKSTFYYLKYDFDWFLHQLFIR